MKEKLQMPAWDFLVIQDRKEGSKVCVTKSRIFLTIHSKEGNRELACVCLPLLDIIGLKGQGVILFPLIK